jgi:ABC-type multidrug transport system fused ATPase/permease subunit
MFKGTIRSNMDPFATQTDQQLWNALQLCGLKDQVQVLIAMRRE